MTGEFGENETAVSVATRYGLALLSVAVATSARLALDEFLDDRVPFITFFLAVALVAWQGGFKPALLATILSAVASAYFFIPPAGLAVAGLAGWAGLAVFLTMGLSLSFHGRSMREARGRAEEIARDAALKHEQLQILLESIGDGVITADLNGQVTNMNPVAQALTGWSASEAIGSPVWEVFAAVNAETHKPAEDPVSMVLGESSFENWAELSILIARDGTERPIENRAAVIRDRSGQSTGAVLVFRDVTKARQVEFELREANRRKTEFLAMLAHELRNPLSPICAGIEIIGEASADPVKLGRVQRTMERQAQHLRVLLDDLVDVSRITHGLLELQRVRVNLTDVIGAAVESVTPLIEREGHHLLVEVPDETILLYADPHRLAQVLSNLLNNATKYTPPGGRIRLKAECQGDSVAIAVKDTGIGIASEELDGIFEMFHQTKLPNRKASSGLGIGLALVRSLVELHGGSVEVSSEGEHHGSEFVVRLPLLAGLPTESSTAEEPVLPAVSAVKRRVLIVDDNKDGASMLSLVVEALSHEVRVANDGEDGIKLASQFRPDLILMDLGMPGMDGFEAARRLREEPWGKTSFLVALTGWGQEQDKVKTREAGFDHHLVKPASGADLEQLFARLDQLQAPGGDLFEAR